MGRTALICASSQGHLEVVHLLLQAGSDVNIKNYNQESALMRGSLSCSKNRTKIVQALIEAGADLNIQDNFGRTVSDLARHLGFLDVVHVFEVYSSQQVLSQILQDEEPLVLSMRSGSNESGPFLKSPRL